MSLGGLLKDLRLKKGESLQDAADAVGISKTHFWDLERGASSNPSIDLLTKIANHYKVSIRFLVGEDLLGTNNDELLRMFRQVGELTSRDKAILDDMIQSMLRQQNGRKGDSD